MKTYKLKVPVYISDEKEDEKKTIEFEELNFSKELLIDTIITKIKKFNEKKVVITTKTRNKTITQNVEKVNYEKIEFGNDPSLLIRITSFQTNILDKYIQSETKIDIGQTDKLGSENHFFVLYPHTYGVNLDKYKWLILLYEDPNKENKEIVTASKTVLNNILEINIKNVKLKDVLKRVSNKKTIPKLSLRLSSFEFDENDEDYKLTEFVVKAKTSKIREVEYENVPLEFVKKILKDTKIFSSFSKRVLKITDGKQQFKLEQNSLDEVQEKINEVAEESYNFSSEVTSEDIENKKVYTTEFIIKKMQPVIENYICYNEDLE
ncbi:hypothetical protein [Tenacibaculum ovolyticum]|uniref:hypothetical protein n=1 Tax=Tenacibaculum ovolyticum TaxID=104270 RepID=UPI003BAAF44D